MIIRQVKQSDIKALAIIYKNLYDNVNIGEIWTIESATKLLEYWLKKQKDLFLVSEIDDKPIGAIMPGVKPWFNGNWLIDTEIFVSKEYSNHGIAKKLLKEHLSLAREKYSCNTLEFHTYGNEKDFPQNWYNRIGLKKDKELIIMHGNIDSILEKIN